MTSTTPPPTQSFLRLRTPSVTPKTAPPALPDDREKERETAVVWGKTPAGEVFKVPATHDVLTALFHPSYPKSHFDRLNLALLASQLLLFAVLPAHVAQLFFLGYFVFWRAAYDAGLGWVLTQQSKRKWVVREVQRRGWLDGKRHPRVRAWIRSQLVGKMGSDYQFDDIPAEYNTWLLFRQAVDVILLNDFLAYTMFAFASFRVPEGLSAGVHVLRWTAGLALIAFNLWVKTEAHRVIGDYAWYWGDAFFTQMGHLVFDGVFELAPHPMYSVGYAGYYGLSLIVGSYRVLFVSLAAHAAQFAFLVWFENPHIERRYGQKTRIGVRTPLAPRPRASAAAATLASLDPAADIADIEEREDREREIPATPTATDGSTATESDALDTETDTETEGEAEASRGSGTFTPPARTASAKRAAAKRERGLNQHDLLNKYFRRDAVLLWHLDLFRTADLQLLLLLAYVGAFTVVLPALALSARAAVALTFAHALAWVAFHYLGLGLVLRGQSEGKFLVRHFLENYHYAAGDRGEGAVREAFANWKGVYNLSVCMTYASFVGLVCKTYTMPTEWTVGNELLRHTLGGVLVFLHIWAAMESYQVLGPFGWFYGDFFMEDFPSHLEYTGIFRYLNNPEVMSGAAFFGLALVSANKYVTTLAGIRYLAHWWFLSCVETPHMRKLYGDTLRKEAGFVKVIRNAASQNARLLESRAGRHGPEIKRVAKEVKGTFDKVFDETAEVVEEFLARSRPSQRLSEVVQDTKVLLQQSRERLVITRLANDLSSYETAKYKVTIAASANGTQRFHVGEQIKVSWQAPYLHSRKDWIGIYKVGSNKSNLITKTISSGMWQPVHDDEWDGDTPLGLDRPLTPGKDSKGQVTFKGGALPWVTGRYEIRYHHDGKHNVLSMDGPFEVYVEKPTTLTVETVRSSLMRIVPLCLDSDPSLIPISCRTPEMQNSANADDDRDPDDFSFWSERQARRISNVIKQTFDVEYAPEVIVADANLSALASRILVSKEILSD